MSLVYKIIARLYVSRVHKLEKKIGYSLTFSYIPESWINGWMIFDMTNAWSKHNIKAVGINYFTVGSLVDGLSSRFIPNKKQYQSWLGAYLVKFKEEKNFTLQDHFNLAVADQKNWLKSFGDPNPYIEMPESKASAPELFSLGQYQGKLYEFFGGQSHSDVGGRSVNWKTKITMPVMAEVMNLSNSTLKLHGNNFHPLNPATNYETVTLKGYVAIIELEKNVKFVLYGNASTTLFNGKEEDYYPLLKESIVRAFRSMVIKKL